MLCCTEADRELVKVPTIADVVPLTQIMSRDIKCARRDLDALEVARLMLRDHIGCMPVVDEIGRPAGMITKLDLVEHLVAIDDDRPPPGIGARSAEQVMMPLAIVLDEHATVAHAAALMANEDIHHMFVVDEDGCLIGVVSTMDIVRWLARNDGFTSVAP